MSGRRRGAGAGRDRLDAPLALAGLLYVAGAVALATAMAWPVYESPRLLVAAGVAMAIATALTLLARRLRWRPWLVALLTAALFVLIVVPVAVPIALGSPARIARGVIDGILGVVLGWKQLLTLSLPLGEYQAVLVPVLVTLLVGSVLAAGLAVSDSRWAGLAVPVAFAMAAFGPVFGSASTSAPLAIGPLVLPAAREVLLGVGLLVLSLVWLILRARLLRVRSLRAARASTSSVRQGLGSSGAAARRAALAVGLVLIALVAGLAVTPLAADVTERSALRDRVDPLLVVQSQPSPLAGYRAWFADDAFDLPLFEVGGETEGVDRIRIATLDTFDGRQFDVAGADGSEMRFARLPRSAPSGAGAQLEITIGEGYEGIWMPVPDGVAGAPAFASARAEQLADGFYIAEDGSTAIDVAGDGSSAGLEAGDAYRVVADPSRAVSPSGAPEAEGGSAQPVVDEDTFPELTAWAELQQLPEGVDGFTQAVERMRERGYLSHGLERGAESKWIAELSAQADYTFEASRSGHSSARIEQLFAELADQQRRAGDDAPAAALVSGIGDDEQFAAAAALLARSWGLESRVVVGVRLAADDPDIAVPVCDDVCAGRNVTAWVEVSEDGGAWQSVDTTPQFANSPTVIAEAEQLPENPTVPDEARSDLLDPPPATSDDSEAEAVEEADADDALGALLPILRVVGLTLLVLLLLALPLLVLAVAKTVRRRGRRSSPDPEVSIVGAWEELVDAYADHRIPVGPARTRLEYAEVADRPAAVALATRVDQAVFAELPPTRPAAEESWELVEAERRELAAEATRRGRLRARLSPASLLRHLDSVPLLGSLAVALRRKDTPR